MTGVDDPGADIGFALFSREEYEFVRGDPASLGDDTVDGAIGLRLGGLGLGIDVENLSTTDGLGTTGLAQDEAVTWKKRERLGQIDPYVPRGARGDGGAENSNPYCVFACSQVQKMRASSRHLVIE
jgi:hypothetical protein